MVAKDIRNILVLTGAGASADSGVPTFRTGSNGKMGWDSGISVHPIDEVATPEAFDRDPDLVHRFYDGRREKLADVVPNAAHRAVAHLEAQWPGSVLVVTQNVDDLHERAGSRNLVHMHGELRKGWCRDCNARFPWSGPMGTAAACPSCGVLGQLRPDIVWFGEMPYEMDRIEQALRDCDLFISIGTSGAVYPAAGFVQTARYVGAHCVELNLEPSQGSIFFHETRLGRASEIVPEFVAELLRLHCAQSSPISS